MNFWLGDWVARGRASTCLVNRRFSFFICFLSGRSVGGLVGWRVGWLGWLEGYGGRMVSSFFFFLLLLVGFDPSSSCCYCWRAGPCTVRHLLDTTVACLFVCFFPRVDFLFLLFFIFPSSRQSRLVLALALALASLSMKIRDEEGKKPISNLFRLRSAAIGLNVSMSSPLAWFAGFAHGFETTSSSYEWDGLTRNLFTLLINGMQWNGNERLGGEGVCGWG
ncbi:hypothetical protein F5144DRAFT_364929 [Chaetomium tenue]|uniref:Uncharacterized protein n=1 Tax=Chaetomium tenue TaxID=1854479 RepID=A0ACB7P1U8_9PEZI|nr:hypothetical protein F5144DRAFT_364929 [Chaetomium globosum]